MAKKPSPSRVLREVRKFAVFGLIPLAVFLLVLVVPFIRGIFFTFTDWNGFEYENFVGLANYEASLADESFWAAIWLTFAYVGASLVLVNLVGFGLALLVTLPIRGTTVLRTFFFVPNLIGGVILGLIWQFLFGQALPTISENFSIPIFESNWLLEPTSAFWSLVIVTVWQMSGYMMIIYVTGLMSIEKDVLEAALIDGAKGFRTLVSIKIPLMATAFTISLFLTLRNTFMAYDVNLALTGGGPYRSTELISLHVFKEAFGFGFFATGQAQAVLMFLIIAVAALTQVVISKRTEVQR
ncbi:MAG: sn-glycerol-3-phosphate transport system permease protein U [Pseudomonadota bacterium]